MKIRKIAAAIMTAALALTSTSISAFASAQEMQDLNIFSGSYDVEGWNMGPQIQTSNGSGTFDPTEITEGGYFTVEYTGAGGVYLAFSEWTSGKWAQVDEPTSVEESGDGILQPSATTIA